jgi:hypothetical protein
MNLPLRCINETAVADNRLNVLSPTTALRNETPTPPSANEMVRPCSCPPAIAAEIGRLTSGRMTLCNALHRMTRRAGKQISQQTMRYVISITDAVHSATFQGA